MSDFQSIADRIRAWGERVPDLVDYPVQTTHPGTIQLEGDTGPSPQRRTV
jgi:hypothetical protein